MSFGLYLTMLICSALIIVLSLIRNHLYRTISNSDTMSIVLGWLSAALWATMYYYK